MILEARSVAHAAQLFEVLKDPAIYTFLDEQPPSSVQELATKLARSESRRSPDGREHWLNWVIRMESGELAGYVQATVEETSDVNVAYVLGPPFQGKGIAQAAVRQMLEVVSSEHRVRRFFVTAEAQNLASIRLAQKLGFVIAPPEIAATRSPGPSEVVLIKDGCA